MYIPEMFEGLVIRVGRWIACPDIEAQYAPDNYLASHSLLFTYDTYTQTGAMFSFQVNQRNMVQGAIQSGTDMAPWYAGALPTGFFGWRWVSESNNDAFYTCLNNINNAKFRYFFGGRPQVRARQLQLYRDHLGTQVQPEGSYEDRSLLHVAIRRGRGWDAESRSANVVRWRWRSRELSSRALLGLRSPELHRVPALEEGLFHGPQRVVAR